MKKAYFKALELKRKEHNLEILSMNVYTSISLFNYHFDLILEIIKQFW